MSSSQTVKGKYWLHHHPRINKLGVDIIFHRTLIISLLLIQASFVSGFEQIDFETMSASFEQIIGSDKNSKENISKGYLVIKKPDYMLWHINDPTEKVIMFKEGLISIYDPDLYQVIKTEIDQFKEANWIRILMGESKLIENFEQKIDDFDSYTLIRFESLFEDPIGNTFTIKIKEGLIEYIDIEHSEKERIFIALQDVEINEKIDDQFFDGLIPNDVDVIE